MFPKLSSGALSAEEEAATKVGLHSEGIQNFTSKMLKLHRYVNLSCSYETGGYIPGATKIKKEESVIRKYEIMTQKCMKDQCIGTDQVSLLDLSASFHMLCSK